MPCEKYQAALIDLAATNARPAGDAPQLPADVTAHLDACSACRRFLEEEQLLNASIDAGVRRTANAPVPVLFLQRLEARLAQEAPATRSWNANWVYVAAAAALIVLMLPILRTRLAQEPVASPSPQAQVAKPLAPEINPPAEAPRTTRALPQEPHRTKQALPPQSPSSPQPEVLVPPEEREAFARFLSDLNGRAGLAVALVEPVVAQHEQATEPVQTPEIQIAALAVQPLEDRNEK
jgi:hypothetical protein